MADEFTVNTTTANQQSEPAVTVLNDGRLFVTWTSVEGTPPDVRARIINPNTGGVTTDFIVNTTTTGSQDRPSAAVLNDGRIVVTWSNQGDISARVFASDGTAVDPDGAGPLTTSDFGVNTTVGAFEDNSSIAALANGGFVVTWERVNTTSGQRDVMARVYSVTGVPGSELLIGSANQTVAAAANPVVTGLTNGDFVVAYQEGGDGTRILYHLEHPDGTDAAGGTRIFQSPGDNVFDGNAIVTALSGGRFAIAWSREVSPGQFDIFTNIGFANGGILSANPFQVNATTAGFQGSPSITTLSDGRFLVTWSHDTATGTNRDIQGRIFDVFGNAADADGNGLADPEFTINQNATNITSSTAGISPPVPAAMHLPSGGFVVTWASGNPDTNIVARSFNPTIANTDTLTLNEDTTLLGLNGALLVNDTDADGHGTISAVPSSGSTAHGSFSVNADGSYSYTPQSNYSGPDSFTYRATDGIFSSVATVNVTVSPVNDAPTLTAMAAAVDTVNEDTQVQITFTEIAAQGNEADVDGTVTAFVVKTVTSGTLLIGTSPGAATAFAVGSNDVIDSTKNAYWTGASNANGTLNAFTVVAKDDGGLQSAAAVQVQVTVDAVNDAPTLTAMAAAADTVNEDTQVQITFTEIAAQGNEADVDGTVTAFVVKAVTSGTLLIGTSPGAATAFAVGTNDVIDGTKNAYWTGVSNANGTLNAFTVVAKDDGGLQSAAAVQVQVTVDAVNDAPTLTAMAAAADTVNEDTQVQITFTEIAAQGNEADVDGTVTAFVVKAVTSGTLLIGTSPGAATAFAVGSNDVIDGTKNAYWTGAQDANGTLNAFTVVAKDDGGLQSAAAVQVQVTVDAVNDAPTLTAMAAAVDTGNEDTQVQITFAEIAAQGNEADVDGTVTAFVVKAVTSGTLLIGTSPGAATAFAVGTNDVIDGTKNAYWTGAQDANGMLNAFTVVAKDDGGLQSAAAVQVQVTVDAVNDAPALANVAASGAYTANDAPITLSSAATVTDADSPNLASATVSITTGFFAGDVLAADVTGTSIDASYAKGIGVLTLTGSDTLAHYQQVLDSVTYASTASDPTNGATYLSRTITWQTNDGGATANLSNAPTTTIDVSAGPLLGNVSANAAYTENAAPVVLSSGLTVADSQSTTLVGATVTITVGFMIESRYGFPSDDVLAANVSGTSIVPAYDNARGILTLSGLDTVAHYQQVLDSVTYASLSDYPDFYGSRTISWQVDDGSGSNNLSNAPTTTVAITGVDDEPTLTATAVNPTFTEGGAAVDIYSLVSASVLDFLPMQSQKITSLTLTVTNVRDGASEILHFDGRPVALTDGNIVDQTGNGEILNVSVSGTTATVSFSDASIDAFNGNTPYELRYIIDHLSYENISQNPTEGDRVFTITEVVDSGSNAPPSDNTANPNIASTVTVHAVNTPPTIAAPASARAVEDTDFTFSGIAVSDVDGGPAWASESVSVSVNHGTLTLSSTSGLSFNTGDGTEDKAITFAGTFADLNSALAGLKYRAAQDYNGPDSLTISADDAGNTGAGGPQSTTTVIPISVALVNDAPAGADVTKPIAEDGSYAFAAADFGFSDPLDANAPSTSGGNSFASIFVTTLPRAGAGTLTLSNGAVTAGQEILLADIPNLKFTPTANANGSPEASFTFQVRDDGGVLNSGEDTDQSANTFTFNITPVNDAPTFAVGPAPLATPVGTSTSKAFDLVLQADGKILLAGDAFNGSDRDFALVRYNPDGTLDTNFSGDGKVLAALAGDNVARAVAVDIDGAITTLLATGVSGGDFATMRFNNDGSVDANFGTGGVARTNIFGNDGALALTIQPDRMVLVAGQGGADFALVRYTVAGALDTNFGTDGVVSTSFGAASTAHAIALQTDGAIVLAGDAGGDFALARKQSDGAADTLFSGDGRVTTDIGGNDVARGVLVQADGKIVVVGETSLAGGQAVIVRYNADGSFDDHFGIGGFAMTKFGAASGAGAFDVAAQADGKLVVAGYASGDFAVARFNTNGTLDTTFDADGFVTVSNPGPDEAHAIAVQADGRIVVAGQTSEHFAVLRLNSDGSVDRTFAASNTLDGAPTYTENGAPVVLDDNVRIYDVELATQGNYNGGSVTLARAGGVSTQDEFSGSGSLGALTQGQAFSYNGMTIGTVTTNSGGTLTLTFNGNATQALIDDILQSIAYRNISEAPPSSVHINWTFSDGNDGIATGSTSVTVQPVNDAPVSVDHNYTLAIDGPLTIAAARGLLNGASDPENDPLLAHSVTGPVHGTLSLTADGSFVYKVTDTFFGEDSFTFKANDGSLDSNLSTVKINVTRETSSETTTNPNGGSTTAYYDAKGDKAWSSQSHNFDSNGHETSATVSYDDGSIQGATFDANNDQPWKSQNSVTNAQGQLTNMGVIYDDGTQQVAIFDAGNNQPWLSQHAVYDALGRQTTLGVIYDDGSQQSAIFDAANNQLWSSQNMVYDVHGHLTNVGVIYDDLHTETAVYDVHSDQPWISQSAVYDPSGNLIATSVSYDDGHVENWHI
jgi:uncharacterized delta-60 repeat protein